MATIDPKQFFSGGKVEVVGNHSQEMAQAGPGIINRAAQGVGHIAQNIGHDFMNRAQNIVTSIKDAGNNKQSPVSAGLQTAGNVAGAVGDIFSETVKPAVNYAADKLSDNPTFQKAATSKTGDKVSGVNHIVTAYTEWARQHPEASRNLEATVNIGSLLLGEKPVQSAVESTANAAKSITQTAANTVKSGTGSIADSALEIGSKIKPASSFGAKAIVGEDLHGALTHFADNIDSVNAFRNGTKTYQSIADSIVKAHDTFDKVGFKQFQKMKESLPDIKVPNSNVVGEIKKVIVDAPPLLDKERGVVESAIDLIRGNKDQSIKGILDLRNRLDRAGLIRNGEDYINSNKVVSSIRAKLNEMAIERATNYDLENGTQYSKQIMQGLKKAESNINFLNNVKNNLIGTGKSVEQTATKLRQIISKIDDPTEFEATKNLLKELEARTGVKIVDDLMSARVAKVINANTKLKGGFRPLRSASEVLNKAAVKGVETFQNLKQPRK